MCLLLFNISRDLEVNLILLLIKFVNGIKIGIMLHNGDFSVDPLIQNVF